jgi:hypothetical protein
MAGTRRRSRSADTDAHGARHQTPPELEQVERLAYAIGVGVMILVFVLLFVVDAAWPVAIAIGVVDVLFLILVFWFMARERR